jgi:hypothetical protein
MSLIDVARDTLKEIPMADILRERLSLALDQSAAFERQIAVLQKENGKLQAQLEVVTLDCNKAKQELRRLEAEHAEEVRIFNTIEFRRGKRTNGQWLPFCPKCHMPASDIFHRGETNINCSAGCGWFGYQSELSLAAIIGHIPAA